MKKNIKSPIINNTPVIKEVLDFIINVDIQKTMKQFDNP